MDLQKTIQKELQNSTKSRYRISLDTGLTQSLLFKIYHNTGGIDVRTTGILLDYFGYKLTKEGE